MLKNSWVFKYFNQKKIVKDFTRPKQRVTFRKLFSLIKTYYVFGTKVFLERYTEIYRHLFWEYFNNAALGRQWMVQCKSFFWYKTERNISAGKLRKSVRFLAELREQIIFNAKWFGVQKMSEVFWAKQKLKTLHHHKNASYGPVHRKRMMHSVKGVWRFESIELK